jgi:kynureninase
MRASLAVFDRAGMTALAKKSNMLTGFLGECLEQILPDCVQIVTPREPEQRGCQLSLKINTRRQSGKAIHQQLDKHSIRTDWREPNVIRAAPVPLYNTFDDALRFVLQLRKLIK